MTRDSIPASVYMREDRFFLCAKSRTTTGGDVGIEPTRVLPVTCSDAALGAMLLEVLDAYQPTPIEMDPVDSRRLAPFLKAVGVRSYKAFMVGAFSLGVYREKDSITFLPLMKKGSSSFVPVPEGPRSLALPASCEAIGRAVREAFDACK
jgi:hypothetical protein